MPKQKDRIHIPVLLDEVLQYLAPAREQSYLDVTAGFGGHAEAVLAQTMNPEQSVLVDRDMQAINALQEKFNEQGVQIIQQDYLSASLELAEQDKKFDMILADLGVSSLHLNDASRGFMFSMSGPLDMRMDTGQGLTAYQVVNTVSESELVKILKLYGQEPKAAQIARRIVTSRPIKTTDQLASIVAKAWPGHSKVHPATRTFQALRIVVNGELTQLEQALPTWFKLLTPGGRLVIISFHSLEDRIVKQFFSDNAGDTYDSEFAILTKKPIVASPNEIVSNPRARSAKLRAVAKIKTKKERN